MKNFIYSLFLLLTQGVFGQIQMKNTILVTPDSAVAYLHMPNYLEFWGINLKKDYTLICNGDTIPESTNNRFLFEPKKGGVYSLELYKRKKLIKSFDIRTERLNMFKVFLGELRDSSVTKYELLNNLYFNVTHWPQLKDPCTSVIDFEWEIKKKNGDIVELVDKDSLMDAFYSSINYLDNLLYEYKQQGKDVTNLEAYIYDAYSIVRETKFYPEDAAAIGMLESGDIVYMKMVTLQCPSCISRKLGVNLKFIIKD